MKLNSFLNSTGAAVVGAFAFVAVASASAVTLDDAVRATLAGNLDLTDGSLDARLVLSGTSTAAGARPDIFMALRGPIAAPARGLVPVSS